MGIYDRDYIRNEPKGIFLGGKHSAVATILFVNVGVFVLDWFLAASNIQLSRTLGLWANTFQTWPWPPVWGLVTHAFLHGDVLHLGLNMLGLWIFGREVETIYGTRRFYELYFSLVVLAGLAWIGSQVFILNDPIAFAIGASGAVSGLLMIYVLHYPMRTLLLFGVAPVPAWLMAVLWLGMDLSNYVMQTRGQETQHIAFSAHLAGAFFGFVFYRFRVTLFDLVPFRGRGMPFSKFAPRPRLRLHEPDSSDVEDEDFEERVDHILAKISAQGTGSLTKEEQRLLERASRKAQQKRRVRTD